MIDPAVLASLCRGNIDLQREAFVEFEQVNSADAQLLFEALDARDQSKITRLAHRIKGASRALGAEALAQTCHLIEVAALEGDWEGVTRERESLHREVARLSAYIASGDWQES